MAKKSSSREYISCIPQEHFISFRKKEIEKYEINLYECQDILPTLVNFAKMWNVEFKDIIDIVVSLDLHNNLFMWSPYGCGSRLIHKNGRVWYENKWVGGYLTRVPHYEDMFVREDTYMHLILSKVGEVIISRFYPHFDIRVNQEICKINKDTYVADIASKINSKMTIGELADLLKNPNPKIIESQTRYNIYGGNYDTIYLPLRTILVQGHEYKYSLYIPIQAIVNKDWSLIENWRVSSIIKPNANKLLGCDHDNWFSGLQKDAPYFNDELVNEYKKLFF